LVFFKELLYVKLNFLELNKQTGFHIY